MSVNSNQTSAAAPSGVRNGITRGTSYTLRDLHGNGPDSKDEEATEVQMIDGRVITITNSGIVHTLSHHNCAPSSTALKLVATLFYNTPKSPINADPELPEVARADVNYGKYVSDMAVFEFVQTMDQLSHPWNKTKSTHKCLDSSPAPRIMEITLTMPGGHELCDLRRNIDLWQFERKFNVEVALQKSNVFRRYKRLAVFDMDSTLIEQEVIDELAKYVGVKDMVSVSSLLESRPGFETDMGREFG